MDEYGDGENSFNLLAICRSPLSDFSESFASHFAGIRELHHFVATADAKAAAMDASFVKTYIAATDPSQSVFKNVSEAEEFAPEAAEIDAAPRLPRVADFWKKGL